MNGLLLREPPSDHVGGPGRYSLLWRLKGDVVSEMNIYTRKWVRPEDLNAHGTLFGGSLLRWIDDEAVVYSTIQLGTQNVVTKFISEINIVRTAQLPSPKPPKLADLPYSSVIPLEERFHDKSPSAWPGGSSSSARMTLGCAAARRGSQRQHRGDLPVLQHQPSASSRTCSRTASTTSTSNRAPQGERRGR